ncbi:MAG: FAD:protein FMN transferase [Defluviicoccus sp.]|nr:FAD:protein FMN transferase [Defluviicoccus sp.]MDG4610290.1 FAD:protein FMN transferase [Defluviicoccus sp.]
MPADAPPSPLFSRRRALCIIAGSAAAALSGARANATLTTPLVWEGTALGAPARLVLFGEDGRTGTATVRACLDEVERLEREFSLYRPDSALSRLNANGVLDRPSLDFFRLLRLSVAFGERTGGAFDVTVQPLWQAYADHFTAHPDARAGPPPAAIAEAVSRVGYQRLSVSSERIVLAPGMAVTLNGIAQGYITDRVADLLRARGYTNVLVEMGEIRALGPAPAERPWSIALAAPPSAAAEPLSLPLRDGAVASSAGAATAFDPAARFHHLFAPESGESATTFAAVTVMAPRATLADALSTAVFVAEPKCIAAIMRTFPGASAILTLPSGQRLRVPQA